MNDQTRFGFPKFYLFLMPLVFVALLWGLNINPPPKLEPEESTPYPELVALLNYLPAEWAETHWAVAWGPAIHFIDVAQIRRDLELGDFTGADDLTMKRDLLLNIYNQGLAYAPQALALLGPNAYAEWGWDMADVAQAIYVPDANTAVLKGDFSRPEVQAILQAGGEEEPYGDFVVYEVLDKGIAFGWKADTLIVCAAADDPIFIVKALINNQTKPGLGTHPTIQALLPSLEGAWGGVLAPSPDVIAFSGQMKETLPEQVQDRLDERFGAPETLLLPWDFMAIAHRRDEAMFPLWVVYHYSTPTDAAANEMTVKMRLTQTPSLQSPGLYWNDLFTLDEVTIDGDLIWAYAHTTSVGFLGSAFRERDFVGFLALPGATN